LGTTDTDSTVASIPCVRTHECEGSEDAAMGTDLRLGMQVNDRKKKARPRPGCEDQATLTAVA
jgi:hypothetical protein